MFDDPVALVQMHPVDSRSIELPRATLMQTKNGLPRTSFAYTPTHDPESWMLPYRFTDGDPDIDSIRRAAKQLSDVPRHAQPMVQAKLKEAFQQLNSNEAEPASLKEDLGMYGSDFDPMADDTVQTALLLNKSAANVMAVCCPCCGEVMIVPEYSGQFDWLQKPLPSMTVTEAGAFLDAMEFQVREVGRRNSRADLALLQQLHDMTHSLGIAHEHNQEPESSEDEETEDEDELS